MPSPDDLTPAQAAAWCAFMEMQEGLCGRIEQRLQAECELSGTDYAVLAALSDAPGGHLRALHLAQRLHWEKSRLHHQLTRMIGRGLVERTKEGRTAFATITAAGREAYDRARPAHSRHLRELVFDRLTPEQAQALEQISRTVLGGLACNEEGHGAEQQGC